MKLCFDYKLGYVHIRIKFIAYNKYLILHFLFEIIFFYLLNLFRHFCHVSENEIDEEKKNKIQFDRSDFLPPNEI